MSRLIKSKPVDDTPLKFTPMGQKPGIKKVVKPVAKKTKKVPSKSNRFAQKAAMALASKG